MKLHRQAHVVFKTPYHLIWVTRYRRKILVPGVAEYFKRVLGEVREFHSDWFMEEGGGIEIMCLCPWGFRRNKRWQKWWKR